MDTKELRAALAASVNVFLDNLSDDEIEHCASVGQLMVTWLAGGKTLSTRGALAEPRGDSRKPIVTSVRKRA